MRDAEVQRARLYPETWRTQIQRTVPVVWSICRELCTPYLEPPARRFISRATGQPLEGAELERVVSAYARAEVDEAMHAADKHLVAMHNATIHVWPDPSWLGVQLLLIPPHDQEVRRLNATSTKVSAVTSWQFRMAVGEDENTDMPRWAVGEITPTKAQWVAGWKGLHNRGIFGSKTSNALGRIPVVMLRAESPAPGEWWAPLPEDYLDAQRAANHDKTDVGHIARLQGYGQPKMKGVKLAKAKEQELGPETIVVAEGEGADFDFARPQPDITGYLAANEDFLRSVIASSGLNPQTFMRSAGITALAKQIELIDRQSARKSRMKVLRRGEQDIFDLIRAWINTQRGAEVVPDCIVEVEYREPIIPADPLHDAQAIAMLIAMSQTSEIRERAKRDGCSLAEAKQRCEDDAHESRELRAIRGDVTMAKPSDAVTTDASSTDGSATDAPSGLDIVPGADVQQTALNGAQVDSMRGIVQAVALGQLPAKSARAMLLAAFPIDGAQADAMLGGLDAFRPDVVQ